MSERLLQFSFKLPTSLKTHDGRTGPIDYMKGKSTRDLQAILLSLKRDGVPDTVAYITEPEAFEVIGEFENIGY